jgi:hypothetical protein
MRSMSSLARQIGARSSATSASFDAAQKPSAQDALTRRWPSTQDASLRLQMRLHIFNARNASSVTCTSLFSLPRHGPVGSCILLRRMAAEYMSA